MEGIDVDIEETLVHLNRLKLKPLSQMHAYL